MVSSVAGLRSRAFCAPFGFAGARAPRFVLSAGTPGWWIPPSLRLEANGNAFVLWSLNCLHAHFPPILQDDCKNGAERKFTMNLHNRFHYAFGNHHGWEDKTHSTSSNWFPS